ncbi:MAG: tRNA (N(6)-L-threonylcarbamoyladenosine(37)-C(2))-methylthiotransferase MtaB [Thermodesulfobacteriota bacterium]|nr:tRNA (N(6)-L-threonylcarbamoyladenosine(37)-C(2))-methylthiotransferase MtaB [Thermodesulfobacteriota bacterium]MDY7039801.1 tRNA (N(6)-L-threonylcarbamoyladenosine(37)-C(2))-methylthiotransferase MtaB [Chloroflexota bacterium]
MRVYLKSLGCKLNQSEMESLARQFVAAGYELVGSAETADLCVLNTCTVTHVAARKSRQAIHRLRRLNPDAHLVVTGCYAELAAEPFEADLVVGSEDKARLLELVQAASSRQSATEPSGPAANARPAFARTRAFVKIQDGCDNACTYCIVRVARGRQRSRPRDEVLGEVRARVSEGYKEVVLTGVHVGAYGRDADGDSQDSLPSLVTAILAETAVLRLRLSSIEPWDLSPDFFELWRDPRMCRHLHLPLQSGCDATLRRMGRRYSTDTFAQLVTTAREAIPGVAITTDLIVGFPGESEEEFAASREFVSGMAFARLHVFPYSMRPGTVAAAMPHQVPHAVKKARAKQMTDLGRRGAMRFRQVFTGRTLEVLWEHRGVSGQGRTWSGLTDNYIRVTTVSEGDLTNVLLPTRLVAVTPAGMRGVPLRCSS